jgi:hypothetical protein
VPTSQRAEGYVEAASAELEAGRSIAAASLAVHAGINAADALTGMRLGHGHEEGRTSNSSVLSFEFSLGRSGPKK